MESICNSKSRKELLRKMLVVFGEDTAMLSTELQEILFDDIITAFENRLKVLNRARSTLEFEVADGVECETF